MSAVRAFILGVREFRTVWTTHYDSGSVAGQAYDWGREVAHRVTLRRFEP